MYLNVIYLIYKVYNLSVYNSFSLSHSVSLFLFHLFYIFWLILNSEKSRKNSLFSTETVFLFYQIKLNTKNTLNNNKKNIKDKLEFWFKMLSSPSNGSVLCFFFGIFNNFPFCFLFLYFFALNTFYTYLVAQVFSKKKD